MQLFRSSLFAGAALAAVGVASGAEAQIYLRGDLGYGWSGNAGITDKNGYSDPNCLICVPGKLNDAGGSPLLGAGVGYRLNDLLRGELGVTYRGGYRLGATDQAGTSFKSDIRSWAVMATGYVDLPLQWQGVRPYLGAGIGWANNHMGTIQQTFAGSGGESDPSGSRSNFAWSLTAGLSFELAKPWTVDLAYRYIDLGRIGTNAGSSTISLGGAAFPVQTNGVTGNLRSNEAVLSVRYSF